MERLSQRLGVYRGSFYVRCGREWAGRYRVVQNTTQKDECRYNIKNELACVNEMLVFSSSRPRAPDGLSRVFFFQSPSDSKADAVDIEENQLRSPLSHTTTHNCKRW